MPLIPTPLQELVSTKEPWLRYVWISVCLFALSGSSTFLQLSELQAVIVHDLHKLDLALLIIQEKYIFMAPPLTAAG